MVMHTCHCKERISPWHLEWGTAMQNNQATHSHKHRMRGGGLLGVQQGGQPRRGGRGASSLSCWGLGGVQGVVKKEWGPELST